MTKPVTIGDARLQCAQCKHWLPNPSGSWGWCRHPRITVLSALGTETRHNTICPTPELINQTEDEARDLTGLPLSCEVNLFTCASANLRLRPYQADAVQAALSEKNGLLVLPTGSGKSHIIAGIVNGLEGNTLILQPTKEILESNFDKILATGFRDVAIFSASMNRKELAKATYGTIGSIINRRDTWSHFQNIIVDEAHVTNPKGGMYDELIKAIQPAALIGLTATPYRLHTTASGSSIRLLIRTRPRIFTRFLHITECSELIDAGFLRQPEFIVSEPGDTSMLKPNSTGADYTDESIISYLKAISDTDRIRMAAQAAIEKGQQHLLIFTPYLDNARAAVDALNAVGISADMVSGTTAPREREDKLTRFRSGEIKAMANVRVLTTGYDFPALDTIIAARPTLSLGLYYQIIGRGVRPYPDKNKVLVYDLVDNFAKFGDPMQMKLKPDRTGNYVLFSGDGKRLTGRSEKDYTTPAQLNDLTIPFGKHKDKKITDVPLGYLVWCSKTFDPGKWKDIFMQEVKRRKISEHTAMTRLPLSCDGRGGAG